jgi:hypothetical protein
MVFSITKNGHTALLPVWPSFGKNFQIEIEMDIMQPEVLPSLSTYGLTTFFDVNNC